ncbi:OmpA family protein [Litorilituus lipolyticus]|uniref:OmpA family protein n=1 Tax=Litorilituus lipolyticus TaxID=2491017 RepID=A0A502KRV9_9GAMM|nr:OmpA family protein [Litorilituus lipolyticus]TPH14266.1 OmpA family protein [Litorilituus lipolyticus]
MFKSNKHLLSISLVALLAACAGSPDVTYESSTTVSLADDDHDGVINARDLCPTTIKGAEINNEGCGEVKTSVVSVNLKLLFDNNSSVIKANYLSELKKFAHAIKQSSSELLVELEGHASAVGSAEYNLVLSQRRANSVKKALIEKFAVEESKLTAVAFGESKLVASGDSEMNHSLNRRVVAHIQINKQEDLLRWNIYSTEND